MGLILNNLKLKIKLMTENITSIKRFIFEAMKHFKPFIKV